MVYLVEPVVMPALKSLWELCADFDGWDFTVLCDQWWWVRGECEHGTWEAASNGPLDLETAFLRLYEQAKKIDHPDMEVK